MGEAVWSFVEHGLQVGYWNASEKGGHRITIT
jgi:hypothetical protein